MFFLVRKTKAERGHLTCLRARGKEQVQSFNLVLSTSNALSTILARYKGFLCITTHSFIQLTYIFERFMSSTGPAVQLNGIPSISI